MLTETQVERAIKLTKDVVSELALEGSDDSRVRSDTFRTILELMHSNTPLDGPVVNKTDK